MSYTPPSSHAGPSSSPSGAGTDPTLYSPEAVRQSSSKAAGNQPVRDVTFLNELVPGTDGFISRYLFIQVYRNGEEYVENALSEIQEQVKEGPGGTFDRVIPLDRSGDIRLRFDGVTHAVRGRNWLLGRGYNVTFVPIHDYARAKWQEPASIDIFEGQVLLTIELLPFVSPDAATPIKNEMSAAVHNLASLYGCVLGICDTTPARQQLTEVGKFSFRVEYDSVDASNIAVQGFKNFPQQGRIPGTGYMFVTKSCIPWRGTSSPGAPNDQQCNNNQNGKTTDKAPSEKTPSESGPSEIIRRHPGDVHNGVNRFRILNGLDVRTTIMLRNIPNKMDWLSLKALLDRYCFGLYDFLYLRIDFKTGSNVGYAFVNFSDLNGILSMIDHVQGRRWDGFRSYKAAEISYATIQGQEPLIQKFRNSSVMHEAPHCKPRLFFSMAEAGSLNRLHNTGCEDLFPAPDNEAKLSRSISNAKNYGLYQPNGNGLTVDQRLRPGAYDNGNPRGQQPSSTAAFQWSLRAQHACEVAWAMANNFRCIKYAYIPRQFADSFMADSMAAGAPWIIESSAPVGVIGQAYH